MIIRGYVVPYMPHPLLAPEASPGYRAIRRAYEKARRQIAECGAERLILYSTQWVSVIGHQIQADPHPEWVHVDPEWHELGPMPYRFTMDPELATAYAAAARERGLHARTVAYRGFPIDTGTIVALKLLDPDNRLLATVVSCNMYSDRAETLVLGKAARDAVEASGKKTVAIAVTALSNRLHTSVVPFAEDRVSSLKDDEWNRKLLQFFAEGRLEDCSQLMRQFFREANADSKGKAIWWLAALLGQHNRYDGEVLEYQPIYGTGAAVIALVPSTRAAGDQEFDEDDIDVYGGERKVLSSAERDDEPPGAGPAPAAVSDRIRTDAAPKPVGAYPHARRVGELIYVSGIGPRQAGSDEIPGGPVRDASGRALSYDVEAQTRAVIENIRKILEAAGSQLDRIVDVTVFLIDMQRDFAVFNRVYAEYFASIEATRTTIEVRALPTPIAVEMKVIARA